MTEVQNLEYKLQKAKEDTIDKEWKKLHEDYLEFYNYVKGKDFIIISPKDWSGQTFEILRCLNKENIDLHHYVEQGIRGQFNNKRWIEIEFISFMVSATFLHKNNWDVSSSEYSYNSKPITLKREYYQGIPLKSRKTYQKAYPYFIETGHIETANVRLNIGLNDGKYEPIDKIKQHMQHLKDNLIIAPSGLFDKVQEVYKKQIELSVNLIEYINKEFAIKLDKI